MCKLIGGDILEQDLYVAVLWESVISASFFYNFYHDFST